LSGPAIDVSQGRYHGLALLENGDVYSWGSNSYGRTGQGTTSGSTTTPKKVQIPGNKKVVKVEAAYYNSMLLCEDGTVYMCGNNAYGRNGNGLTSGSTTTFTQVIIPGNEAVKSIAHCGKSSLVVTVSNKLYAWGYNYYGTMGTGNATNYSSPQLITLPASAGVDIGMIAQSNGGGAAVSTDGTKMWRWGYAVLGLGATNTSPVAVTLPSDFELGEVITAVATQRWRATGYNGACIMIATNLGNLFATGMTNGNANSGTGTNGCTKLGVINIETGARITAMTGGFNAVQDHGIYSGTVVTGISIGNQCTIITTGTNTAYRNIADYTAYGSGYNYYYNMGAGSRYSLVFGSVKK
jgi:hypothetical protein